MTTPSGISIFDADNHFYEPPEALTRHLPDQYRSQLQYVKLENGRTKLAVGGKISEYIPNPTFGKVAVPGGAPRELPALARASHASCLHRRWRACAVAPRARSGPSCRVARAGHVAHCRGLHASARSLRAFAATTVGMGGRRALHMLVASFWWVHEALAARAHDDDLA